MLICIRKPFSIIHATIGPQDCTVVCNGECHYIRGFWGVYFKLHYIRFGPLLSLLIRGNKYLLHACEQTLVMPLKHLMLKYGLIQFLEIWDRERTGIGSRSTGKNWFGIGTLTRFWPRDRYGTRIHYF